MRWLAIVLIAGGAAGADEVADVVDAERAFSRRCGEVGVRASFLEYFAPDAISFAPDPGAAHERLEKRKPLQGPPPVTLEWAPEQAELAGDLGWTTGPYLLTDRAGKEPPGHGYYFSLWRKQADGSWKVELDMGGETPAAPLPTQAVAVGTARPSPDAGVARADEAFCRRAEAGVGRAYTGALAANARVHRDKTAPLVGAKVWRPWAARLAGVMSCKPIAARTSNGAGLGYAYGSWERRDKAGGPVVAKGYYTRVWRFDGAWKIAVDVANTAP